MHFIKAYKIIFLTLLILGPTRTCICAPHSESTPETHIFYYGWYGAPEVDGAWRHWNHTVILREGNGRNFEPPDSIGSNFYPADGLYSSNSMDDVVRQMRQIKSAGVDVIAVTWWGRGDYSDHSLETAFTAAEQEGLKVCFHIEPFPGRNATTTRESIVYLLDKYGERPGIYRCAARNQLPIVYLYDSYLTPAAEWATVFSPDGAQTLRNTAYDVAAIALWVKKGEETYMREGGFDGFYTYFATDGFTYGSTPSNWSYLSRWAKRQDMLFIPSVGPGYVDTRIRPWNNKNTRDREQGAYYDRMFRAAMDVVPPIISITSFNEWHEGTQIEPAMPKKTADFTYEDYGALGSNYYLERTRYWVDRMKQQEKQP